MTAQVEEHARQAEEHRKENDKKLALILERIDKLVTAQQAAPLPAPVPGPLPAGTLPAGKKPYLVNPELTPELSNTIVQVCGSAQSRAGKSKEGNALMNGMRVRVVLQDRIGD